MSGSGSAPCIPYSKAPRYTEDELNARDSQADAAEEMTSEDSRPTASAAVFPLRCDCGKCKSMPTILEQRCCHAEDFSMGQWMTAEDKAAPLDCVLQSTHVQQVIGEATVQISWLRQRRSHGFSGAQLGLHNMEPGNYRYHAYRNYIELIYLRLGPRNRRVIPACVVSYIRSRWPSPDHRYVGYKESEDDEQDELDQLLAIEDL